MGEDECGFGDVVDLAGAGGDVLEGASAAGEDGEAAFAQAAQATEESVAGAVVHVECQVTGGLFDRGVPRRRRSACCGRLRYWASSRGTSSMAR
jgi:hypothetical protein